MFRKLARHRTFILIAVALTGAAIFLAPGISSSTQGHRGSGAASSDRLQAQSAQTQTVKRSKLERKVERLQRRVTRLEAVLASLGFDEWGNPLAPAPSSLPQTQTPTQTTSPTAQPTTNPTRPPVRPTPTQSPTTQSPTTQSPTQTPTQTPSQSQQPTSPPTTTPSTPGGLAFPTRQSAGVPNGWTPTRTVNGTYTVSTEGAVVEDMRINGDLVINAANVTVRRVEVVGGSIDNFRGPSCKNGLVIKDTTVRASGATNDNGYPAIGAGGYRADNVLIDGMAEGFRVGGKGSGCGPVTIANSYAFVTSPTVCGDWHGDTLQGYDGGALTLRSSVLILEEKRGCGGTAPFFYPDSQGNTSVDISGLIVQGGGYSFRLGTSGTVQGLYIVDDWGYGPIDVRCGLVSSWSAQIATLDANGQPVPVRNQSCSTR